MCPDCLAHPPFLIGEKCRICGRPVDNDVLCHRCRHWDFLFEAGTAAFSYETMQEEIAAFKFHGYRHEGERLSHLMAEYLLREQPDWTIWADVLTEVPLHPNKLRFRGFNQAEIFANGIAEMLNKPMYTKIVERIHDTKPQKQLNPGERKSNLKKAFRGNLKEYQRAGMPKRVLLVDDIYTTGSTAEAVTVALKQLGIREVYVFCIAIGKGFS